MDELVPVELVDVKIENPNQEEGYRRCNEEQLYIKEELQDSSDSDAPEDVLRGEVPTENDQNGLYKNEFEENSEDEEEEEEDCEENGNDDLEYKVAHFLAQSSSNRNKQKPGGKLKCSRCSALFRYKSTLSYHLKSDCGTKIIVGTELIKKRSSKEAVECDVCKKKLCSRTSLMVHMRIHTGERPFECHHCGKGFFQKAHLRDHVRSLHSPGQYLCRACNLTFPERAALDSHIKTHFPKGSFACQECGKEYTCKSSLSSHILVVHTPPDGPKKRKRARPGCESDGGREAGEGPPWKCPRCGSLQRSAGQLRRHLRLHTAPKACPHCPRNFPSTYDLRIHLRSHTGERPFGCEVCGRGFARKSTLEMHQTLHTGRKDYACTHCDMAFNRKSKLDIHMSEHLNTSWLCGECNKSFKCKSYLDSHLKTHIPEANFRCDNCGRKFRSQRGVSYHRRSAACCRLPPAHPLCPSPKSLPM